MFKKLLINTLMKRGASAVEEMVGKGIRHGMTVYGGVLLQQGLAEADDITALSGGGVALAGILLSIARIWIQNKIS